jgi:hypothetical protein
MTGGLYEMKNYEMKIPMGEHVNIVGFQAYLLSHGYTYTHRYIPINLHHLNVHTKLPS